MDVAVLEFDGVLDVDVLELEFHLVAVRDHPAVEVERERSQETRRHEVGAEHAAEGDAGIQDGDDLRIGGHACCEVDHRDEHEQRREQVGEVGDEVEVVVEYDLAERRLALDEVVDLFRDIENDRDQNDQCQGEEERPQELADDIAVEDFQEGGSDLGGLCWVIQRIVNSEQRIVFGEQ